MADTMGDPTNPYDVLEASKEVVRDLNRALYGEPAAHTPGLFDKVDALSAKLDKLSTELDAIKRKRPNITNWALGYVTYYVSVVFAILTILNIAGHTVGNLPPEWSMVVAVVLAFVALAFFLTGFGWLGGE